MISEEKNAREALFSSQAKKLPALMRQVVHQAVTPGPGDPPVTLVGSPGRDRGAHLQPLPPRAVCGCPQGLLWAVKATSPAAPSAAHHHPGSPSVG